MTKTKPSAPLILTLLQIFLLLSQSTDVIAETKADLDDRVRNLISKFDSLQADTEARIPPEKLKEAMGVIIMERTKGGFIVGYEKGSGVAMVKNNGMWSPIIFMKSHQGSVGAQIGGKTSFIVVLLMNEAARDRLLNSEVDFGGEATGTGGDEDRGVEGSFMDKSPVLTFGTSKGLYGGAVIKGGSAFADDEANQGYYGNHYSPKDILFDKKIKRSEVAAEFARKLDAKTQEK